MQCKFHSKPRKAEDLSVFLITYFTVIQTDNYIFHISALLTSVSWTSNHATYDVSWPKVVETVIHGQCYGHCFLYCV